MNGTSVKRCTSAALALMLSIATPALAQLQFERDNTGFGTASGEFLSLGAGARAAALGGAYAALAVDASALYWNPAGIVLGGEKVNVQASHTEYLADTGYDWVGVVVPLGVGTHALGVHFARFGFSDQQVFTEQFQDGELNETYSVAEAYVGLTYARAFTDRFSAGATFKVISDQLAEVSGTGFAFDLGTNFHTELGGRPIRGAFTIQNLGGELSHTGTVLDASGQRPLPPDGPEGRPEEPPPARLRTSGFQLPILFRVALAYDVLATPSGELTLLSEFNQPNNNNPGFNVAGEYRAVNIGNKGLSAALRIGWTLQPDNSQDDDVAGAFSADNEGLDGLSIGGGLGYRISNFDLLVDYAFKHYGVLGGTDTFSIGIAW